MFVRDCLITSTYVTGIGNVSSRGTYNFDRCTSWCRHVKSTLVLQTCFASPFEECFFHFFILLEVSSAAFRHDEVEEDRRIGQVREHMEAAPSLPVRRVGV